MLGGCSEFVPAYMKPLSANTQYLLQRKDMSALSPILVRIFKQEKTLEIWKEQADGRFHLLKSYPICYFSGDIGPKQRQGDRQSPEGFYTVSERQMNPHSREHLAFNVGYPNAYDRSMGRTGDNIMVHGGCRSIGCFAMTDKEVQDIYVLARDAFAGGQEKFQLQSFPFRMTAENMAKHKNSKWYPFWQNLKQGYDYFEETHLAPNIAICEHRYLINTEFVDPNADPKPGGTCPAYRRLPVVPYDQPLVASSEHSTGLIQASLSSDDDTTSSLPAEKPEAPKAKPTALGAALGLVFGPSKPNYHMFTLGPAVPNPPPAAEQ